MASFDVGTIPSRRCFTRRCVPAVLRQTLLWTLVSLACFDACAAIKLVISPGKTECVGEMVTKDHFEVPGGPRVDGRVMVSSSNEYYAPFVTVRVLSPQGEQIWQQQHVYSETHFNVGAKGPGSYRVCFYNPWESRVDAVVELVYFTLAHLRRATTSAINIPKGTSETRSKEVAHAGHVDEVKRTILGMSEFMTVIQGSQRYLTRKLERHKLTMESTSSRHSRYMSLEVCTLLAVTAAQVLLIRRFLDAGRVKIMGGMGRV